MLWNAKIERDAVAQTTFDEVTRRTRSVSSIQYSSPLEKPHQDEPRKRPSPSLNPN